MPNLIAFATASVRLEESNFRQII
ncbi:uncharacterized protein METZ01_LOCUS237048 [marine metagenome]|uniref:Uncharacterized protein n=1 Tax=marine metagenome TaxID=408172 RepID=A0A382HA46_9ZZZZ